MPFCHTHTHHCDADSLSAEPAPLGCGGTADLHEPVMWLTGPVCGARGVYFCDRPTATLLTWLDPGCDVMMCLQLLSATDFSSKVNIFTAMIFLGLYWGIWLAKNSLKVRTTHRVRNMALMASHRFLTWQAHLPKAIKHKKYPSHYLSASSSACQTFIRLRFWLLKRQRYKNGLCLPSSLLSTSSSPKHFRPF